MLDNLVQKDYEKIPKEYIDFLKSNCNNEYNFEYDSDKSFNEQELLQESKYILFGLFEKFGTTDKQKGKIESFKSNYYNKLEEEKRDKYNPNDIFKNRESKEKNICENQYEENKLEMISYKESVLKRFINKIKRVFKRY